jgi:transcriptional regulator with XRE-family HTH domain
MLDQQEVASLVRSRLRHRRVELGLSIDDLAERSLVNASTISRIETGRRLPGFNHLVPLATALGLSLDELVTPPDPSDIVIRPEPEHADGLTYWQLTRHEQPGLPRVFKLALPARRTKPPRDLATHPGREWLYVLSGTLRLVLGDRELLVPAGSTASFDTTVPHWLGAHGGPTELLGIFDVHAERTHLPSG